ncbi:hypothetical protein SAMN02745136_04738 [Anaerocolumna jejuensis DSM 15929]|uniref:Uncharacterized protein n=1 Tax=Anaerocolumna jejuensis DSM 15929 TaxID=1121322 RepID=A0A1M7A3W3_9FIRM|nr:hypothetical protein [Anaerocolumna jejuensis]SHL37432.1 hypothetical protein SAMN02745136_04738 [Anaerocolumna jejuensis DSM 15929]
MKSVKKILMGIAIILLGIAISLGPDSFLFIGWVVSIIGLIMSFIGYYFTEDE